MQCPYCAEKETQASSWAIIAWRPKYASNESQSQWKFRIESLLRKSIECLPAGILTNSIWLYTSFSSLLSTKSPNVTGCKCNRIITYHAMCRKPRKLWNPSKSLIFNDAREYQIFEFSRQIDTLKSYQFHLILFHKRHPTILLFEIFIFCPKSQLWFPEKIVDFLGWKTREIVVVFDFLSVDSFDFTRKIVKKSLGEKLVKMLVFVKIEFLDKIWPLE